MAKKTVKKTTKKKGAKFSTPGDKLIQIVVFKDFLYGLSGGGEIFKLGQDNVWHKVETVNG